MVGEEADMKEDGLILLRRSIDRSPVEWLPCYACLGVPPHIGTLALASPILEWFQSRGCRGRIGGDLGGPCGGWIRDGRDSAIRLLPLLLLL